MVIGRVVDELGAPVDSAVVIFDSVAYITDQNGIFSIERGTYDIEIMHRGFETTRGNIAVSSDFTIELRRSE